MLASTIQPCTAPGYVNKSLFLANFHETIHLLDYFSEFLYQYSKSGKMIPTFLDLKLLWESRKAIGNKPDLNDAFNIQVIFIKVRNVMLTSIYSFIASFVSKKYCKDIGCFIEKMTPIK